METTLDHERSEHFYELYERAFASLRTRAAGRQVLHRHEFMEEMTDPRIWKYTVVDATERTLALGTLTRHLETVPWISPEYYQARYPEAAARNALYYFGFILADPSSKAPRAWWEIMEACIERVSADNGVGGMDICSFNLNKLRLHEQVGEAAQRIANGRISTLDEQTYFMVEFG